MYKKILVGYDGSEKSQEALDRAADLADYHDALLVIVHVMKEKPPISSQPLYPRPENRIEDGGRKAVLVEKREEKVHLLSGKGKFLLRKARNRLYLEEEAIQTELRFGDPAREIVTLANMEEVDLIVLGNRGLNGLRKFMLGSVSQKVAQHAEIPVMIIK